jgi:hypothetical protein
MSNSVQTISSNCVYLGECHRWASIPDATATARTASERCDMRQAIPKVLELRVCVTRACWQAKYEDTPRHIQWDQHHPLNGIVRAELWWWRLVVGILSREGRLCPIYDIGGSRKRDIFPTVGRRPKGGLITITIRTFSYNTV